MQYHYLSSYKMTILIGVDCGKIITTPPIAKVLDEVPRWINP